MSSGHLRHVQVIRLPHEPIKIWITRNKGRLTPYLVWLYEPTFINKRWWVVDANGSMCPVMSIEPADWPKEFPKLRPGQKKRVGLADWKPPVKNELRGMEIRVPHIFR